MSEQGAFSNLPWYQPEGENNRYYCHTCEAEFDNVTRRNDEVLCQNCNNGFVELIETPQEPTPELNSSFDVDDRQFLSNIIQDAFQRGLGLPVQTINEPSDPRLRGTRVNATIRNHGPQPLEHILSDLLVGIGGGGFAPEGHSPLVFLGNPGDYAWGREGLDTIVTQLLNQMDGSGPPPLSTDKIKEIPLAHITKAQIDSNLQCSVCWETFTLDEAVKKLPCEHFYHTPCIEPWLALHGTCPICRQALHSGAGSGESSNNSVNDMTSALADGLAGAIPPSLTNFINGSSDSYTPGGGLNLGATLGSLASVLLGGNRTPSTSQNSTAPSTQSSNDSNNSTSDSNPNSNPGRSFFDMDFD